MQTTLHTSGLLPRQTTPHDGHTLTDYPTRGSIGNHGNGGRERHTTPYHNKGGNEEYRRDAAYSSASPLGGMGYATGVYSGITSGVMGYTTGVYSGLWEHSSRLYSYMSALFLGIGQTNQHIPHHIISNNFGHVDKGRLVVPECLNNDNQDNMVLDGYSMIKDIKYTRSNGYILPWQLRLMANWQQMLTNHIASCCELLYSCWTLIISVFTPGLSLITIVHLFGVIFKTHGWCL